MVHPVLVSPSAVKTYLRPLRERSPPGRLYNDGYLEGDTRRLKYAPQSWPHEPNQMVSNTSKYVPSELFVNFLYLLQYQRC